MTKPNPITIKAMLRLEKTMIEYRAHRLRVNRPIPLTRPQIAGTIVIRTAESISNPEKKMLGFVPRCGAIPKSSRTESRPRAKGGRDARMAVIAAQVTDAERFIRLVTLSPPACLCLTRPKNLRGGTASTPHHSHARRCEQRLYRKADRSVRPTQVTPVPGPASHWRPSRSRRCWRRSPDCPACRISRPFRSNSCEWRS